jgi:hypothetical protein
MVFPKECLIQPQEKESAQWKHILSIYVFDKKETVLGHLILGPLWQKLKTI